MQGGSSLETVRKSMKLVGSILRGPRKSRKRDLAIIVLPARQRVLVYKRVYKSKRGD